MRNASGHQCKVKMSGSEKVNENTCNISSKKSVRSFWKFDVEVVQNNRQRNVQKKCDERAKLPFLLIRPIIVFHCSSALPSPLSITRFYILFEQTLNIIETFAFSPG